MNYKYKLTIIGSTGRTGSLVGRLVSENNEYSNKFDLISQMDSNSNLKTIINESDVIIDFSAPISSLNMLKLCIDEFSSKKLIIGTTGFDNRLEFEELLKSASEKNAVFYSGNMSIGIGLLCRFLKYNKGLLNSSYEYGIHEIHHNKKKDKPSGTALMLASNIDMKSAENITSSRIADVFGIHDITIANNYELIEIRHQALNRELFADGALKAAMWLLNKDSNGLYGMDDLLS